MPQLLIASLFAIAFGTIYIWGTWEAIDLANACTAKLGTADACKKEVTDIPHLSYLLTTIGNIISGSIVGILALTRKDELPAQRLLNGGSDGIPKQIATFIPLAFILVWIGCGVASVIYGLINNAEVIPPLTAQAKGWIGSAGTALLAYIAPVPAPRPPAGN